MTATRARRTESEPVRRAQLLRAARNVFRAKGYDGASVSEIVREAGVAQGTFYLYFPSKRDAAVSLRDGLMETMAQAGATAVKSRTSFEDRLESLIAAGFKVARRNADLFRLAFIGADETHLGDAQRVPGARLDPESYYGSLQGCGRRGRDGGDGPGDRGSAGNRPASACHDRGLCFW